MSDKINKEDGVQSDKETSNKKCIFCQIAKREIISEIVHESDNFIAIKDINPVAEGHMLVIPKKHFVTLLDIPNKLGNEMLEFCKKVSFELLEKKLGDGFNLVMNNLEPAGQFVMHAHIHIIPRKEDDRIRFLVRV
ncbi:MAG: HIT domain-containing protein [Candidatus Pacearchaeota archaeon]|nr:HIT domain-containing protein [Candidatus Pacearchaeota archaeon]